MQIGTCWLKFDKAGSNVQLSDVTPAQAVVLRAIHSGNLGGADPVSGIQIVGDVVRTSVEEKERLSYRYGNKTVEALFPGVSAVLPTTFEVAKDVPIVPIAVPTLTGKPSAPSTITVGAKSKL
jgi:hypothetical protein